jgi:probable HAF family extracellular repeat protein
MSISMKKFKARCLARAGACTLAAILAACGGGGGGHGGYTPPPPPPPPPPAGLSYDVIPLSLGGPGKHFSVARRGINAKGQVVGAVDAADGNVHAFLYDGDKMLDLGTMGGESATAYAINALGQAAGWANLSNGKSRAFLYDGTMHDLGTLGGELSIGQDINDGGQVIGSATGVESSLRVFLYQNGAMSALPMPTSGLDALGGVINNSGTVAGVYEDKYAYRRSFVTDGCHCAKDLGTLGGNQTYALAINDAGQIAGYSEVAPNRNHAFRYENGVMTDLGTLGGDIAEAYSINATGWVTGFAATATGATHAFVHDGKTLRDLGTLGGADSRGEVINASGRVVGASTTAANEEHAMTWTEAGGMLDLNKALHTPPPGLVLTKAITISANGAIVAQSNSGLFLLKPRTGG